jgi:L-amino acid N-acyltransferase YncA
VSRLSVRPATPKDWPAIWPILEAVVREGETYAYAHDMAEPEARATWLTGREPRIVLVAVDEAGRILGSAKAGPNQAGPGSHVANASFIVAAEARGRGVARRLGEAVLDWARGAGFHAMQFNAVVAANAPAVHLWQALGFAIIGTVPEAFEHPRHGRVGLHIMYRRL